MPGEAAPVYLDRPWLSDSFIILNPSHDAGG
jgi:hypothetical protein